MNTLGDAVLKTRHLMGMRTPREVFQLIAKSTLRHKERIRDAAAKIQGHRELKTLSGKVFASATLKMAEQSN
jgi:hypothetical protein